MANNLNDTTDPQKELLRLAALKNCEGVSFLGEEELDEAIASFAVAYHCIGRALRGESSGDEQQEGGNNEDEAGSDNERPNPLIPPESVDKYHFILDTNEPAWFTATKIDGETPVPPTPRPPQQCFVYDEALVFHPQSASDPREVNFFEAVILFNMAITFHQHARIRYSSESGGANNATAQASSTRKNATRGLNCYNHCLKRLKEGNYEHSTDETRANLFVEAHMIIVSLNNKAQVLVELGDFHEAFWILRELESVMTFSHGNPPGFKPEEIRGLQGTVELLRTSEFTAVHEAVCRETTATSAGGGADDGAGVAS
ncbi:expressed unknown protein [Seminavis robusta]|uniref:Uncharacterized protein n=1 Tax=Seminavis robusta TaxID=568900 RepID=A0A9N8DQW0_9STRA|nr:expressed unknown protein [Seminavis robusta]|eukprot:Sro222_g091200.1 n/a (315) ;mRNA; f:61589-62533